MRRANEVALIEPERSRLGIQLVGPAGRVGEEGPHLLDQPVAHGAVAIEAARQRLAEEQLLLDRPLDQADLVVRRRSRSRVAGVLAQEPRDVLGVENDRRSAFRARGPRGVDGGEEHRPAEQEVEERAALQASHGRSAARPQERVLSGPSLERQSGAVTISALPARSDTSMK
jgi:hypothetical protein